MKNYTAKEVKKNLKLKKKNGNRCVYCDCTNQLILTIDHKMPVSRGGKETESNKQIACFICNQLKGSLTDSEFKKYLKCLYELKNLGKLKVEILPPKVVFNAAHYPFWWGKDEELPKDKLDRLNLNVSEEEVKE